MATFQRLAEACARGKDREKRFYDARFREDWVEKRFVSYSIGITPYLLASRQEYGNPYP